MGQWWQRGSTLISPCKPGDPAGTLSSWTDGTDECTWSGVTCSGSSVTALALEWGNISSTLPDAFQHLTQLQQLQLRDNRLHGSLPAAWSALASSLQDLDLRNNQITGTLPGAWQVLTSLTKMNFLNNQLSSTVPDAYAAMPNLFRIIADNNTQMCGMLSSTLVPKVSGMGTGIGQPCPSPPPPPPSSSYALLTLKGAVTSDPSEMLSTWSLGNTANMCTWYGVTCDGGSVVQVDVSFCQLQVNTPTMFYFHFL